jgi:hypothetical protein
MTSNKPDYPRNTPATVKAVIACHNALVLAYARGYREVTAADDIPPPLDTLLAALPQGSFTEARFESEGPHAGHVAVTIGERKPRYFELEAFLCLRALGLFETGAIFIDKNNTDETKRKDYVEVFSDLGLTVPRLLMNAQQSERVMQRQGGDYHDLTASNLRVVRGSQTTTRGRREVIEEALKAYDKNAEDWGLSGHLSRWDYQALIENCFRLYDIKNAHHFLRVIGRPDAAYPHEVIARCDGEEGGLSEGVRPPSSSSLPSLP